MSSAAVHHHHHHHHAPPQPLQQYPSPPSSSPLPASLIATRPILPLPKRRVPSTTSSSSTTASTSPLPFPPPQIFSHTYPPTTPSKTNLTYVPGYDDSDSEDEGDDTGSTTSSVGREDFNSKNKKKRKIPLSATSTGNIGTIVAEIGIPALNRSGSLKGRLSGWRVPSATLRTDGGYLRRKTRVFSRSMEDEVIPQEKMSSGEVDSVTNGEQTSPAPSGLFSFTCPSPLTLPIIPPVPPATMAYHPSVPPTTPLPVPPPPPVSQEQENTPPQQAYSQQGQTQQQQQQQTAQTQAQPPPQPQQHRLPLQGMKHPNSEKARRVAQLTKLRERYRTGPKPMETVLPPPLFLSPYLTV
jgi:hypothetical protein